MALRSPAFMLYDIFSFLVSVGVTLVGAACLVRAAMRWRAMSFANPVGEFVLALSDWIVRPLLRVFPTTSRLDIASLVATWLLKLLQYATLMVLPGMQRWSMLPILALLGVAKLAITVATVVIIITVVLSWMRSNAFVADVLQRLCEPWLAPIRRFLPNTRGIDFSPLVAVLVLQIIGIVLSSWQVALLGSQALLGLG